MKSFDVMYADGTFATFDAEWYDGHTSGEFGHVVFYGGGVGSEVVGEAWTVKGIYEQRGTAPTTGADERQEGQA